MDYHEFPEEEQNPAVQETGRKPRLLPKKKRSRKLGVTAFLLAFTALLLLAAIGIYGFLRYRNGALAGTDISIFSVMITVGAVLAGIGFLLGIVTLFLKKQRKGFAVSAILIALVVLLICIGAMYAYQYIFSELHHDETFSSLNEEELHVVKIDNGEVIRETTPPESTESQEKIEEQAKMMEIEFEYLQNDHIPARPRAMMDTGDPDGPCYLLDGQEDVTNFMLFGTDKLGSSDANIILSVDRAHKKIKLISIARDSYVMIPFLGGYSKLTYAYNFGGPQGSVQTVNYNYSLNIRDYISVDFEQLVDIVDLLGGVDVELSENDQWKYNSHMNGEQALRYTRDRSDSEINRTGRQRNVVLAMMDKVRQMKMTDYPPFIRACFGMCTTSFGTDELLGICLEVVQNNYTVESSAVLENVDFWGGKLGTEQYFYCVYDLNRASDWIYRTIYENLYLSGYADNRSGKAAILGQAIYQGIGYEVPDLPTVLTFEEDQVFEEGVLIPPDRTPENNLECNLPGQSVSFTVVEGDPVVIVDGKHYFLR